MTIQEAIHQLKSLRGHCKSMQADDAVHDWKMDVEALDMAIAVMREKLERSKNEPLTLDRDLVWWWNTTQKPMKKWGDKPYRRKPV